MSDLLALRVVALFGPALRVHVRTVHPDQLDVPCSKNVALQIVVDAYFAMKNGFLFEPATPIGRAERLARAAAHPKRALLERWLELAHGRDVAIGEAEYERLRADDDAARSEGVSCLTMRDGRFFKNTGPAYRALIREAEREVASVRLEGAKNHPRPSADAPDAEGILVATFSEPLALSHLVRGLAWSSALYEFDGWQGCDTSGVA
jgi:hypothetical protein